MKISLAGQETGLAPDTIRYYERRGVLPSPVRSKNGYRDYTGPHLISLHLAAGLREVEVPLDRISLIVGVAHDACCGDLRRALVGSIEHSLTQIDQRIEKLQGTRGRLRAIHEGLRSMTRESEQVPGLAPCDCVKLVGEGALTTGRVRLQPARVPESVRSRTRARSTDVRNVRPSRGRKRSRR